MPIKVSEDLESDGGLKPCLEQCIFFFKKYFRQISCINVHVICRIYKNGTDEPICKADIETQPKKTNV